MVIESLESKPPLSGYKGSLGSKFFTFDSSTLIENMKQSHAWAEGEHNSMVLLRTPEKSIFLTATREGTEVIS